MVYPDAPTRVRSTHIGCAVRRTLSTDRESVWSSSNHLALADDFDVGLTPKTPKGKVPPVGAGFRPTKGRSPESYQVSPFDCPLTPPSRLLSHVHPGVHMRRAAEKPKHRRAFDLPDVPHAVVADVFVFVEGHVQVIEAVFFDQLQRFVGVGLAEWGEHVCHDFAHEMLLVARECGDRNSGQLGFAGKPDGVGALFFARLVE